MINGLYLDGKSSKRHSASLEVNFSEPVPVTIVVHYDDGQQKKIALTLAEMKVQSRIGSTPREIMFGDGKLFVTESHQAVDDLVAMLGGSKSLGIMHKLESSLSMVLAAIVITLLVLWFTIDVGIPTSAKYIAYNLPSFTSKHFGSSLDLLDKTMFDPSELDESRQQHIQKLVAPYLKQYKNLNAQLKFRSSDSANAFALPDGNIVFTDDIVNMVETDQQLLAILFHEIGHLEHRHIMRRALQGSMVTVLVVFITGDIDNLDLMTGLPTLLLDLNYSKEFELEADYFSLELLHSNNFDLDSFATVMQRLDDYYKEGGQGDVVAETDIVDNGEDTDKHINETIKTVVGFLSSHPATYDRIALVEEFKKNNPR